MDLMIVDFHTHAFPDALAPKALSALLTNIDNLYVPVHDGTVSGLLQNMDDWGIGISVIQPVVTKPSQVKTINEWAASICCERIISFGSIFPHTDDYRKDIDYAVELGLKGLKFHAEYQDFVVDDKHMLNIYDYALGKGLILLHHAGFDPAYPPPFRSSPRQFANVVQAMRGGIIIAAHLGGHDQWDDVERYLVGSDIYLDTAMGFEYFPHDLFMRIVKKHGADKILFGSDAPWSNACTEIEQLKSLPLPKDDINAILGGTAMRILGLYSPS
jgi:predicted TIM-barrel fold metal-dependent hydrolase